MPPPAMILEILLYGGLLPAALAACFLLGALRWPAFAGPLGGLALFSGLQAASLSQDLSPLRPSEPWQWIPYLPLLGLTSWWRGWLGLLLLTGVAVLAATQVAPVGWTGLGVGSLALVLVLLAGGLTWAAESQTGPLVPLLLLSVALGAAVVCERGGFGRVAQMAAGVAAVCGGCVPLALWRPHSPWNRGIACAFAATLVGLLVHAEDQNFGEVPQIAYVLVLLAPLGLCWGSLSATAAWRRGVRILVISLSVLLPLLIAVTVATWT